MGVILRNVVYPHRWVIVSELTPQSRPGTGKMGNIEVKDEGLCYFVKLKSPPKGPAGKRIVFEEDEKSGFYDELCSNLPYLPHHFPSHFKSQNLFRSPEKMDLKLFENYTGMPGMYFSRVVLITKKFPNLKTRVLS